MGIGLLLLVLVVAGLAFVFYVLTIGRVKHGEEIAQAELGMDELRASNPEYNFEVDELDDGTIKFIHNKIDATALFDPDKKLLHLKSLAREHSTEDCQSQEDAGMAFEDYLREIYDPNPAELHSEPYPTPKGD